MTSTAELPDDWRQWPPPAKMRLLWTLERREKQSPPPGEWRIWLIQTGRGFGKTRTGAEESAYHARIRPNSRVSIVAPTFADGRDTCIEGESGLLAVLHESEIEAWNRSLGELSLKNGSRLKLFSSEQPDRLRGPQSHFAWCDELSSFRYPEATWNNLMLGLRLPPDPRCLVTTTPKPMKLLRQLHADPGVIVTRGHTDENRENLAPAFIDQVIERFRGSTLGRQELGGELLDEVEGALFSHALIQRFRQPAPVKAKPDGEPEWDFLHMVVAVDPAFSGGPEADEAGIIVAGCTADMTGWIMADRSARGGPDSWAPRALDAYAEFGCDYIVVEGNLGGAELVTKTIHAYDRTAHVRVVNASRGKRLRAEPIAALYEQGKVHHHDSFPELEDQMCGWTPESGRSPDRLDALVYAITDLLIDRAKSPARTNIASLRGFRV